MSDYLNNPFCRFKTYFPVDPSHPQDIISVAFFKIQKPYRDFHFYENGLKLLARRVKNGDLGPVKLRVFSDPSITQDPKYRWIQEEAELVEFQCADFFEDPHHRGLFGTFARFFPMFDFPNNDARTVYVVDVDVHETFEPYTRQFQAYRDLPRLISQKAPGSDPYLVYLNSRYYDATDRFYRDLDTQHTHLHLSAGKMVNLKRIPHATFLDFLQMMKETPNYSQNYMEMFLEDKAQSIQYPYGVDEHYLNYYLLPYMEKNNLLFVYPWEYSISSFFERTQRLRKAAAGEVEEMLKECLDPPKWKNFRSGLWQLRKLEKKPRHPQMIRFARRFYHLLRLMRDQKTEIFMEQAKITEYLKQYEGIITRADLRFSDGRTLHLEQHQLR